MSSELEELYSDIILDSYAKPQNKREIKNPTHHGIGDNPICGDHIEIFLSVNDNNIEDISFSGKGCAFCIASSSLMTECLNGKSLCQAQRVSKSFCGLMLGQAVEPLSSDEEQLLEPLYGIKKLPIRIKCVALCWRALENALDNQNCE